MHQQQTTTNLSAQIQQALASDLPRSVDELTKRLVRARALLHQAALVITELNRQLDTTNPERRTAAALETIATILDRQFS